MKSFKLFLFALLTPFLLTAQADWEIGFTLGGSNYQGDLVETTMPTLKETNIALGLSARYYITPIWSVSANAYYGKLSGSDANFKEDEFRNARSVSFESILGEFSITSTWEPLGEDRQYARSGNAIVLSPYLFAGAGLTITQPEVDISEFNGNDALMDLINTDIQNGSSNLNLSIPLGFGLKADVADNIFIGMELGIRYPFSDYLDGISQAGNPDRNDLYMIGGLQVGLKLN